MAAESHMKSEKKVEKATVLLTLAAETGEVRGPCLSDEEMAAMADGRSGESKKPELWNHLGSCSRCYEEWLFLRKSVNHSEHRGRLYRLSGLRKFRYIGTVLAAAASIAVYMNVVKIEDKITKHTNVPQTSVLQDKNITLPPPTPPVAKEEKGDAAKEMEQAEVVLPTALPAAPMAVGSGLTKGRLAVRPEPQRSMDKPQEERQKQIPATPPVQVERRAAKAMTSDAVAPVAKRSLVSGAVPPKTENIGSWIEQLQVACQSGRYETDFWNDMVVRGVRLQSLQAGQPKGEAEEKLATVLALVQQITEPDLGPQQCRLILVELAKYGESK